VNTEKEDGENEDDGEHYEERNSKEEWYFKTMKMMTRRERWTVGIQRKKKTKRKTRIQRRTTTRSENYFDY